MTTRLPWLLAAETTLFAAAAALHAGLLGGGYQHWQARIAETVIAVVLGLGLAAVLAAPRARRPAALAAQGFALLGTCVGLLMIAIGVGPRSMLDVGLHATMVTLLVAGLVAAARRAEPALSAGAPARGR